MAIVVVLTCIVTFYRIHGRINICSAKFRAAHRASLSSSRRSGESRAGSRDFVDAARRFIDADRQLSRNRSTRCPVTRGYYVQGWPRASIDRLEYRLISPRRYRRFARATPGVHVCVCVRMYACIFVVTSASSARTARQAMKTQ